jgi:arylsulfatase A-like enzyme
VTAARRFAGVAAALAFVSCSPRAQVQDEPLRLVRELQPLSIGNETRLAVVLHSGRRALRVPARLPARAELAFGYAVASAMRAADGARGGELAPASLTIELVRNGNERETLFEQRVDPRQPAQLRWQDARLDLSAHAGEQVELELALRAEPGGVTPIAGFAEPTLASAGAGSHRPNLLVVSLDTLRARNVGAYGHTRDTTPFLDSLAAAGVLFENAITASVTTGPAHMSLFTGLYPVHHGMRTGLEPRAHAAAPLAALLRAAGYECAAFTEDGYIVRALGFGDGFSEYTENPGHARGVPGDARVTFHQAQEWLERAPRRPFFLFVHTYQVHAPYLPPPETAQLFRDDGAQGTASDALRPQADSYDREIRFVDQKLRELVAVLERLGLRESTTLVVLSDHGEEFGEHGYFQHGSALFEESLRVPLIFAGHGIPSGRRVAEQVSLIDVAPTLLELLGVAPPPLLDGHSLVPALRGEALPARTLFAEATAPGRWRLPFHREPFNPPLIAARSQQGKLLVHRPATGEPAPPLRYDLAADALEQQPHPLAGDELAAAQALVDDYLRGREGSGGTPAPAPELDPELRKRLEDLGYVVPD